MVNDQKNLVKFFREAHHITRIEQCLGPCCAGHCQNLETARFRQQRHRLSRLILSGDDKEVERAVREWIRFEKEALGENLDLS